MNELVCLNFYIYLFIAINFNFILFNIIKQIYSIKSHHSHHSLLNNLNRRIDRLVINKVIEHLIRHLRLEYRHPMP